MRLGFLLAIDSPAFSRARARHPLLAIAHAFQLICHPRVNSSWCWPSPLFCDSPSAGLQIFAVEDVTAVSEQSFYNNPSYLLAQD